MGLNWIRLVEERNVWVAHNFPDPTGARTPLDSILGCIEELGELTHCHLKQAQSIRGSSEQHEAGAKDAVGDLSVYLLGVMSYHKVYPVDALYPENPVYESDKILLSLAAQVGSLGMIPSYRHHAIRQTVSSITVHLLRYCQARGWDYERVVMDTWNHVRQRDWIKYPDTGMPPAEESCLCSEDTTNAECPVHGAVYDR